MDSELNATLSLILSEMKNTNAHLEQIDSHLEQVDARLDGIDIRLDSLDHRMDGLELRMDGLEQRIDGIELHLEQVDARLDKLEESQELLFQQSLAHTQAIHAVSNDLVTIRDSLLERLDNMEQKQNQQGQQLAVILNEQNILAKELYCVSWRTTKLEDRFYRMKEAI